MNRNERKHKRRKKEAKRSYREELDIMMHNMNLRAARDRDLVGTD
jgi:hypothetical protein